jgi:signal transduction histidine kinase
MARRIAEERGGAIGVRSEVGKGSDFYLTLPLR